MASPIFLTNFFWFQAAEIFVKFVFFLFHYYCTNCGLCILLDPITSQRLGQKLGKYFCYFFGKSPSTANCKL
jgi:hypothetical protein